MNARPKIVVVDVEEKSLFYLSTILERMNFEVFPVKSAQESFALTKVVKPDLLFLETSLGGGVNSLDLLKQIASDSMLSKTPVVMVGSDESRRAEYFAAGCSDYLAKPFGLTFLHRSVQKCFAGRRDVRQHLRAPLNKNVSYEFRGTEYNCFAITLSEGGVYLRTKKPLPVNSTVKVKLSLGQEQETLLSGNVIYTIGLGRGNFLLPPGMAVQFENKENDEEKMKVLSAEVSRLLIGDIAAGQDVTVCQSGLPEERNLTAS